MQLTKKIKISGYIKTKTGLHIGGSKSSLDIGGIDNAVIKTVNGTPYIPGSSIKGKLRGLLAKSVGSAALRKSDLNGSDDEKKGKRTDDDFSTLKRLFGPAEDQTIEISRLIVRDAFLVVEDSEEDIEVSDDIKRLFEEQEYTEEKTENVINRLKGTAQHPRNIERVPAGAYFKFNMVLNIYGENEEEELMSNVKKALGLLEDDYLGGSGTRGYGQVSFENMLFQENHIEAGSYKQGEKRHFNIKE